MQEKILQIENYMFECYLDKIFAVRNRKKRKMSKQEYKINVSCFVKLNFVKANKLLHFPQNTSLILVFHLS